MEQNSNRQSIEITHTAEHCLFYVFHREKKKNGFQELRIDNQGFNLSNATWKHQQVREVRLVKTQSRIRNVKYQHIKLIKISFCETPLKNTKVHFFNKLKNNLKRNATKTNTNQSSKFKTLCFVLQLEDSNLATFTAILEFNQWSRTPFEILEGLVLTET